MTIFELHRRVLHDYRDFVRSFLVIAEERAGVRSKALSG